MLIISVSQVRQPTTQSIKNLKLTVSILINFKPKLYRTYYVVHTPTPYPTTNLTSLLFVLYPHYYQS